MAIFNGHTVTNDGRNLLGRALSGAGKIIFTKAAFGQGTYTGDLREIKELVDKRLDCVVSDILNDRGTVNIKIQVTNKNLTESFRTEEFGIYAKIEGDATEILYCYAAAQESDAIPNNSFGDTFMAEHTVYLAFSSDAEADIYIKEGAIFLTRDTADKSYINIGLQAIGDLSSGRTSLEANKIYRADNGKWYKNIGGDRVWLSGVGFPDALLKEISWEEIYNDFSKKEELIDKKSGFNLEKTNSYELDDINKLVTAKALYNFNQKTKSDYEPKITVKNTGFNLNKTDSFNESDTNKLTSAKALSDAYSLILGNNFGGYIQTVGLKQKGKIYISTTSNSLFICTADTSITYVDYNYFTGSSLVDILRTTFSQAKTVLTPTQGFSVTYRQIRGQLASIIFQNLITANSSGVEYFLPFPINAIASATATSASTNNYVKLVASTENTFKLFCDTSVSDVQVQLMVYAKNSLIDW